MSISLRNYKSTAWRTCVVKFASL